MAFFGRPQLAANFQASRATLIFAVVALAASGARAQTTCVGTDDIVCTNSGTVVFMGDPPSGPLGGTTSLTNINTATGIAGSIQTTANRGDATTINYGTVHGNVGSNNGEVSVDSLKNATVANYGTVDGIIRAITYFSNDAIINNTGVAGTLIARVQRKRFWLRQSLQQRGDAQYQRGRIHDFRSGTGCQFGYRDRTDCEL